MHNELTKIVEGRAAGLRRTATAPFIGPNIMTAHAKSLPG